MRWWMRVATLCIAYGCGTPQSGQAQSLDTVKTNGSGNLIDHYATGLQIYGHFGDNIELSKAGERLALIGSTADFIQNTKTFRDAAVNGSTLLIYATPGLGEVKAGSTIVKAVTGFDPIGAALDITVGGYLDRIEADRISKEKFDRMVGSAYTADQDLAQRGALEAGAKAQIDQTWKLQRANGVDVPTLHISKYTSSTGIFSALEITTETTAAPATSTVVQSSTASTPVIGRPTTHESTYTSSNGVFSARTITIETTAAPATTVVQSSTASTPVIGRADSQFTETLSTAVVSENTSPVSGGGRYIVTPNVGSVGPSQLTTTAHPFREGVSIGNEATPIVSTVSAQGGMWQASTLLPDPDGALRIGGAGAGLGPQSYNLGTPVESTLRLGAYATEDRTAIRIGAYATEDKTAIRIGVDADNSDSIGGVHLDGIDLGSFAVTANTGQAPDIAGNRVIGAPPIPRPTQQVQTSGQYTSRYEMPYDVVGPIDGWRAPEYRMDYLPGYSKQPHQKNAATQGQNDATQAFMGALMGTVVQGLISGATSRAGSGGGSGGPCVETGGRVCWMNLTGQ